MAPYPINNASIATFFTGSDSPGTYSRNRNRFAGMKGTSTAAGAPTLLNAGNVSLASQIIGVGLTAEAAQNKISQNAANAAALLSINQQRIAAGQAPFATLAQASTGSLAGILPLALLALGAFLLLGK